MNKLLSWLGYMYTSQHVNFTCRSTRWDRFRCGHIYIRDLNMGMEEQKAKYLHWYICYSKKKLLTITLMKL